MLLLHKKMYKGTLSDSKETCQKYVQALMEKYRVS